MYRFDETDPANRAPQGAIPHGQSLSLTFRYQRGFCMKVRLLWKVDEGEARELPMPWLGTAGIDDLFSVKLTTPGPGLYWYWFLVDTKEGAFIIDRRGPGDEASEPYQLTVYDKDMHTPDWIKGGVMYHIFVDRFARGDAPNLTQKPGSVQRKDWGGTPAFLPDDEGIVRNNDFFGGNLAGIIANLPYLQAQGVTCLYLSPIFEADSNHKYDTGDYKRIDPGFGDEDTLRALCTQAKARGMRVILDGVFSHVGIDSVYFNQYGNYESLGAYQSKQSPYYDWFLFKNWPDEYACWWDILLLPAINKNAPSYKEYIAGEGGVATYWLDYGVSGWRLDVVDELPDAFLDPLCEAIRRKQSDALIIGEVWEDASNKIAYGTRRRYFLGGQLNSVMNYPLKDAIIAYLREGNVGMLADTMAMLVQNYPKPVLDALMNILGTHDTMRILTVLGGERFPEEKAEMDGFRLTDEQKVHGKQLLKIAATLQFTLPGFPCVYYGDEAGMEGGADPFNRRCYPWGAQDEDLLAWYRMLADVRGSIPAFREGAYRLMAARGSVFAFTRGEGRDAALVAVNTGEEDYRFPWSSYIYDYIGQKTEDACVVRGRSAAILTRGRLEHDE